MIKREARIGQDEGLVLFTRPWRETSLLVEVFTQNHGKQLMMARGARRPQSLLRGQLLPFHRLFWHWRGKSGKGEMVNVSRVEWLGKISFMPRHSLISAHYINELLHRFLHPNDPHERLYDIYTDTITALTASEFHQENTHHLYLEACLRRFEVMLLQEVGYGLRWHETADTHQPIEAHARYLYKSEHGLIPTTPASNESESIQGDSLLEMAQWVHPNTYTAIEKQANPQDKLRRLSEQKNLLRRILQELLPKALHSRTLAQELQTLRHIK